MALRYITVVVTHPESGAPRTLQLVGLRRASACTGRRTSSSISPHALYLVVWKRRAGQDKDDVAGWVERILQRVGDTARVMVVATHSDEAAPDLDYATDCNARVSRACWRGHYAVDNKSGRGIRSCGAASTERPPPSARRGPGT